MDIKLFLIFVVMLSAMHQGPAVYREYTCVEPEPGYLKRLLSYFSGREIENVCPTLTDLIMRNINGIFTSVLLMVLPLLLGYVVGNAIKEKSSIIFSTFLEWKTSPSLCRHCGTAPCLAKRRYLWKPSGSRKRDKANFAERSNAMLLFNYGLELSVMLTKELPQDDLYWERKFCHQFKEKHMALFPLCIQRQINYWYPVPR
ncbi:uncharacterized protein LOC132560219 [Ylistrum balloti]|uniref:uncharacterized protein LOC132560219 n=1 Tax=Ylistrum balloti TaxID=509963 RepID=UPI002905E10B|nr:uncharacterized protein LOC132560219 [Ylistrum balloti]